MSGWANVQSAKGQGSSISSITTGSLSVTAGNLAVFSLGAFPASGTPTLSITDTGGNTWTAFETQAGTVGSTYTQLTGWYAQIASTASITITGHSTGTGYLQWTYDEFSYTGASSFGLGNAVGVTQYMATGTTTIGTPAVSGANANLLYGAGTIGSTATLAAGSGFTSNTTGLSLCAVLS